MSASDLIENYAVDVTLTETAAGVYSGGIYQPGTETQTNIRGSVQPVSGNELLLLGEGDRERTQYKFYTVSTLTAGRALKDGDRISYRGEDFELRNVVRWIDTDLDHFKAMMWKVNL